MYWYKNKILPKFCQSFAEVKSMHIRHTSCAMNALIYIYVNIQDGILFIDKKRAKSGQSGQKAGKKIAEVLPNSNNGENIAQKNINLL